MILYNRSTTEIAQKETLVHPKQEGFGMANIGIGILSYNRLHCVRRLLESMLKYGHNGCDIYLSHEAEMEKLIKIETGYYTREDTFYNIGQSTLEDVVCSCDINPRGGVAVNTNRLMRRLEKYKYKLILNDDVEVLKPGWQFIYSNAILFTGIHHFCFNQEGYYPGERAVTKSHINGIDIKTWQSRPQGAVIAFDQEIYEKVGLFDESFGQYGMEHVDWSWRCSESGLQQKGVFDRADSNEYFKVHSDASADPMSGDKREVALEIYKTKWKGSAW